MRFTFGPGRTEWSPLPRRMRHTTREASPSARISTSTLNHRIMNTSHRTQGQSSDNTGLPVRELLVWNVIGVAPVDCRGASAGMARAAHACGRFGP